MCAISCPPGYVIIDGLLFKLAGPVKLVRY